MNKRQVVVLWIVALVLAVAAFITRSSKSKGFESKTERSRGQTVFTDFPADQVAKIKVSSGENATTLVRKDGKWTVEERGGYPAKTASVNEFLRSLAEVKVTEGIEAQPSLAPRFGMDPKASKPEDRGTEAVLSNDAGTELAHVTLGKNLQSAGEDPMAAMMGGGGGSTGRFIRNHTDESGVYKVSEMFSALSPEPKYWLNDEFVKIEKIKSISISDKGQADKTNWLITRDNENGEFKLDSPKPGENLDSTVSTSMKTLLSFARFEDVMTTEEAAKSSKPAEKITAKIETFEGFAYTITVEPAEAPKPKDPATPDAPPAPEENYLMTVNVEATLPTERKKEEKESEEDAKAKDTAFTTRKAELEKRLAAEKAMAGKVFKVTKYTVEPLLKLRSEVAPQQAPGGAAGATPPPGAGIVMPQQGGAVTPPVQVPPMPPRRKPVEAVTPPIAIPPLEEGEKTPQEAPQEEKPAEEKKGE